MNKWLLPLFILTLCIPSVVSAKQVTVNGKPLTKTYGKAMERNHQTFVPIRAVTDALKAYVEYHIPQKTLTITRNQHTFQNKGNIEGFIKHSRLYVPATQAGDILKMVVNKQGDTIAITAPLRTNSKQLSVTKSLPTVPYTIYVDNVPLTLTYGQTIVDKGVSYVTLRSITDPLGYQVMTISGVPSIYKDAQQLMIPRDHLKRFGSRWYIAFKSSAPYFGHAFHKNDTFSLLGWDVPASTSNTFIQDAHEENSDTYVVRIPKTIIPHPPITIEGIEHTQVYVQEEAMQWVFTQRGYPIPNLPSRYRFGFSATWK